MLTVTVQAANDAQQTFYSVPIKVGSQTLNLTVLVAQPGSLLTAYNNAGISDDTDVTAADFDSDGNSYSAQALAAAGLSAGKAVTIDGVTFTWPHAGAGLPRQRGGRAARRSRSTLRREPRSSGSSAPRPTDPARAWRRSTTPTARSARYWLGLSDWTLNAGQLQALVRQPGGGDRPRTATARDARAARTRSTTSIFYAALPVDPSKTLKSVTLPPAPTRASCTSSRSAPRRSRRPAGGEGR